MSRPWRLSDSVALRRISRARAASRSGVTPAFSSPIRASRPSTSRACSARRVASSLGGRFQDSPGGRQRQVLVGAALCVAQQLLQRALQLHRRQRRLAQLGQLGIGGLAQDRAAEQRLDPRPRIAEHVLAVPAAQALPGRRTGRGRRSAPRWWAVSTADQPLAQAGWPRRSAVARPPAAWAGCAPPGAPPPAAPPPAGRSPPAGRWRSPRPGGRPCGAAGSSCRRPSRPPRRARGRRPAPPGHRRWPPGARCPPAPAAGARGRPAGR